MVGGGDRGIGGGGKEGDWECGGCRNRNYAFRSFCNRCKQPRVLVDIKTPADSKWLPRIGDWICTACTNNNYASREKCKKCGQPKELAAMPAVAIHGASVSSHSTYFARTQGRMEQLMNVGSFQSAMSLNSSWLGGAACQYRNQATDPYGSQQPSNWLLGDGNLSGTSYSGNMNQLPAVLNGNGWRSGDWMCTCGFHNYSSRLQCKKCNAPSTISTPSSLFNPSITGTKRLASEEFVNNWDNKRLNAGQAYGLEQQCTGFESIQNPGAGKSNNIYPATQNGNNGILQNWQVNHQVPHVPAIHTLIGKGAKQWREGDWMCSNCHNHNYASRAECNRCRTQREVLDQPVTVA